MNRLFKYFSIFGILLVFAAYFFRLFEVNGYVKAIAALTDPSDRFLALGKMYKIDYFFIALIMASCLVSLILMNSNKKLPLFSVSLIPVGAALLEKIFIVTATSIIAKRTEDINISIANIVNIVILALGLFTLIISILVERFLDNKPLSFVLSLSSLASITASSLISVYAAIIGSATIHFILFSIFFLSAVILFVLEFIFKARNKKVEAEQVTPTENN